MERQRGRYVYYIVLKCYHRTSTRLHTLNSLGATLKKVQHLTYMNITVSEKVTVIFELVLDRLENRVIMCLCVCVRVCVCVCV